MTDESPRTGISKTMSKNAVILIARQSTIQLFSLFASVILARLLTPRDFGLYAVIGFFLQFLTLVSDGGIGASLIQREQAPDKRTLCTAFTVIQVFYLGTSMLAVPGALLFTHVYKSTSLSVWMIYTFILEFYLSSFRVIPAVQLERNLKYSKLAVVETLEYLSFQIVAVILAMAGRGVWSFIFGALVSRLLGIILLNILSPFVPKFGISFETARPMIKFGAALQLADVLGFLQSALTPSFIAFQLGTTAVGFSNFARKVGSYPTYPLNVVNRMMFPVLSRIQANDEEFHRTLNHIVKIYNVVLFGTTTVLLSSLPETVRIVFGAKWMHSTVLMYSVLLGTLLQGYSSPITAAVMAKGRGKIFLITSGAGVLASWGISVPAVLHFGYIGLVTLNVSGLIAFPVLLFMVRKYFTVRIWSNLWRPLLALTSTVSVQRIILQYMKPNGLASLVAYFAMSAALYSLVTLMFDKQLRNRLLIHLSKVRQGFGFRKSGTQEI